VGAGQPKRLDGEDGLTPFEALLAEMDDAVGDAVISGATHDPVLAALIDITIASIREDRPLYPDLLDEPILYRHFRGFVKKALGGLEKIENL
jgi:hypothetical protein